MMATDTAIAATGHIIGAYYGDVTTRSLYQVIRPAHLWSDSFFDAVVKRHHGNRDVVSDVSVDTDEMVVSVDPAGSLVSSDRSLECEDEAAAPVRPNWAARGCEARRLTTDARVADLRSLVRREVVHDPIALEGRLRPMPSVWKSAALRWRAQARSRHSSGNCVRTAGTTSWAKRSS